MNTVSRLLCLWTASILTLVVECFSQIKEYSPYECYDDWMLKFKEFSTVTDENGSTFLDSRPLEWVQRCVGYENRDPNDRDDVFGRTALHYLSTYFGAIPAMEYLLESGADIEARDKLGVRPLHSAIYVAFWTPPSYLEHITLHVKFLLEKGANPNSQDSSGFAPIHYATARNYTGVIRLLIDHDANVNIANNGNLRPIHIAAAIASPLATKLLVDSGADVNVQTKPKLRFNESSMQYVMDPVFYEGKDAEIGDIPSKHSPLHFVAGYEGSVFQLWIDDNGEPTQSAVESMDRHRDTCRFLVKAGGNVYLRDEEGKTAHEIAYIAGYEKPKEDWEKVLSRGSRECAKIFSFDPRKQRR